jgi:uncharacterized membrane protein
VTQAAHRVPRGRRPAYWQSALAAAALVAIFGLVASEFSPALGAAFVVVAAGTLASVMLARRRDLHELQRMLALILAGVLTVGLAASVALVIAQLVYSDVMARWLGSSPSPPVLLRNAAVIWLANVVLFAFWYWELDAGGPLERHRSGAYQSADLDFPQRQHDSGSGDWVPDFLDYIFFSFNTSTAFSPTDTLVMSRRMKVLMMCQSLISLAVLAVVAARAVNALAGP